MKNAVIAKIAMTASEEYADALKLCQVSHVKEVLPKEWIPMIAGKQAFMHSMAEYHQALVCQDAKNYGQEISRLTVSMRDLSLGNSMLKRPFFVSLPLSTMIHGVVLNNTYSYLFLQIVVYNTHLQSIFHESY